ncbi:MAG: hypothetical protein ABI690_19500 [Chloroflexota bacterium]
MGNYDPSGNLRPDRQSKYRRPRRPVSLLALFLGLIAGIAGGLLYAWAVNPRVEFNTEPWQLNDQDRAQYIIAITLDYSYDGDLSRAVNRLIVLKPKGDPIQEVADVACKLATTGYVDSSSGLRAIRSMMLFYQLQGRTGCADTLIPVSDSSTSVVNIDVPTPTVAPPASKTPTPEGAVRATLAPTRSALPTTQPQTDFDPPVIRTYCDTALSGLIEVFVQDYNGDGIPGQAVRVRWDGGESTFFTGLKPERGPSYADFQMEAGKGYTIDMPGRSDPSDHPLVADPCTTEAGKQSVTSYRVYFRQAG